MENENDIEIRSVNAVLTSPSKLALFPTLRLVALFEAERLPKDVLTGHCIAVRSMYHSLGTIINERLLRLGCGEPLQEADSVLCVERHRQPYLSTCPWCKQHNVTALLVPEKKFQMSWTERFARRIGTECDHVLPLEADDLQIITNMQAYEDQLERVPWLTDVLRGTNTPAPSTT